MNFLDPSLKEDLETLISVFKANGATYETYKKYRCELFDILLRIEEDYEEQSRRNGQREFLKFSIL